MEIYIYDVHTCTASITVLPVSQLEHKDSQHGKCWTLSLQKTSPETFGGFVVWQEIPYISPETECFHKGIFLFHFPRTLWKLLSATMGIEVNHYKWLLVIMLIFENMDWSFAKLKQTNKQTKKTPCSHKTPWTDCGVSAFPCGFFSNPVIQHHHLVRWFPKILHNSSILLPAGICSYR